MNETMRSQKRIKTGLIMLEQDDVVLLIFELLDFPTLVRIQRVCTYWKRLLVHRSIPGMLGNQAFLTREELKDKIRKYCGSDKIVFAEGLARRYGWPIGKWNVSLITDFSYVFEYQHKFNEDINDWDMFNATDLSSMFMFATSFNQDLFKWNTSKVTNMLSMFRGATCFDGDISTWNTSNVVMMWRMFYEAPAFNGDISRWDTSKVETMYAMFVGAIKFNQNISSWNVSNVQNRRRMFENAESSQEENRPVFGR